MPIINCVENPFIQLCQDIAARDELPKNVNFQIYPLVNAEGYTYAQTVDRSWSNNRNIDTCSGGINLERNFDSNFDQNEDCRSPDYGGKAPESEQEVRFDHNSENSVEITSAHW